MRRITSLFLAHPLVWLYHEMGRHVGRTTKSFIKRRRTVAKQVWTYEVVAKGKLGGFQAFLVEGGHLLLVSALSWKGMRKQPRITLVRYPKPGGAPGEFGYHEEGFKDWLPRLEPCKETHTFEGSDEYAQNLPDQWISQTATPLPESL